MHAHRWLIGVLGALLVAAVLAPPSPALDATAATVSASSTDGPTWRLKSYRRIGYDRSFKADLIDELPAPPQLVVFGGSRSMRLEPSFLLERTGLAAFNCSVQNCRPTDAYAFASYLYSRAPDVKLECIFAVQTATFSDKTLHPGLLYDPRLSRAFPADLVAAQKELIGKPPVKNVLGVSRYGARGLLLRNSYDIRRVKPDYSFSRVLDGYIRRLSPKYAWTGPTKQLRSRSYFEKTMRLFNEHGVVPAVVVMPYHPRALTAFRKVGFQKKMDVLLAYLRDARTRCDFRLINLLSIRTFDGRARWFYDGAHPTKENSRLLIRRILQQ